MTLSVSSAFTGSPKPPVGKSKGDVSSFGVDQEVTAEALRLLSGKPLIKHSDKNFILMNCASAIANSEFEGGNSVSCFRYCSQILGIEKFPIDIGLNSKQLETVKEATEDLIAFDALMDCTPGSGSAQKCLGEIKKRCGQKGYCYLPSGWIRIDNAHYASLKIRQLEGGQFVVSLINYGGGAQYHNPLSKGHDKEKRDYQSDEYMIDLDSTSGKDFLQRLILLQKDTRIIDTEELEVKGEYRTETIPSNLKTVTSPNEDDLYALLRIYGTRYHSSRDPIRHGVTCQRSGNCPMANTRGVARDVLIENIDPLVLKRFQFVTKLVSIIEAFKACDCTNSKMMLSLHYALHELQVRAHKLYPEVINGKELALSAALFQQMTASLEDIHQKKLREQCAKESIPSIPTFLQFREESKVEPVEKQSEIKKPDDVQAPSIFKIGNPTPYEIHDYLNRAIDHFKSKSNFSDLIQLRQIMYSIPLSSGEVSDPYWDKVPSYQLGAIFGKLSKLVNFAYYVSTCTRDQGYSNYVYRCEVGLIAYDIAAQLAHRMGELRLGKQFTFALDDVYTDQYFFHDVESYSTVKRIIANFKNRSSQKTAVFGHINMSLGRKSRETYNYVMECLLSQWDRMRICKKYKGQYFPTNYDDNSMFKDLMTDANKGDLLPQPLNDLIGLSCFVHTFGKRICSCYLKPPPSVTAPYGLLFWSKTNAIRELEMREAREGDKGSGRWSLHKSFKYIPRDSGDFLQLHSYIENLAFHPRQDRKELAKDRNFTKELKFSLIQPHTWGSRRYDYYDAYFPRNFKGGCMDEKSDEDFRVIEAETHLQVQKSLEWAQYHPEKLDDPLIQQRLFSFLFEYGKLEEAFRDFPEDLFHLLEIFQTTVLDHHLKQNNIRATLWVIRTLHYLRDHIQVYVATYQRDISSVFWIDTKTILQDLLSNRRNYSSRIAIAELLVSSCISKETLSKEEQLDLLCFYALASMRNKQVKCSLEVASNAKVWLLHRDAVANTIKALSNDELSAFADKMIHTCVRIERKGTWILDETSLIDGEHGVRIHILTGHIQQGGKDFEKIENKMYLDPLFRKLTDAPYAQAMTV